MRLRSGTVYFDPRREALLVLYAWTERQHELHFEAGAGGHRVWTDARTFARFVKVGML